MEGHRIIKAMQLYLGMSQREAGNLFVGISEIREYPRVCYACEFLPCMQDHGTPSSQPQQVFYGAI